MIISNREITQITNHSLANSLAIVDIPVSYDEDNQKIEDILTSLCTQLTKSLKGIKGDVELLGINSFDESAIVYRIVVETEAMEHYRIQREILKEVKVTFDCKNIEIPYKQVVIHNGKKL